MSRISFSRGGTYGNISWRPGCWTFRYLVSSPPGCFATCGLLRGTMVDGSYSELIHLFALSRALATTIIQSYCPSPASSLMHPYTAYTNQSSFARFLTAGFVTVMWTATSPTDKEPINVVLLVPCQRSSVLRCDVQQWVQTTGVS